VFNTTTAADADHLLARLQQSAAPVMAQAAPPVPAIWLRPKDAARAAGISRALLYDWLNAGRLISRKIGGCRLISATSLAELEDAPGGRNGRPRAETTK
jgi:hypothetical protein